MRKWVSSPEYQAAVEVLVQARVAQGLTQREVERRLGKAHHGWLAKIEVAERQMNVVDLIAIARAIGVDERQLFDAIVAALPRKLDV